MVNSVLIVDDSKSIRHALHEVFNREADFNVCGEAEDGQEAIQKAQELHPDLVVLDLCMPTMNGLEVASILSQTLPATPLIVYSLYLNGFSEEEAQSAGISAVVSKIENVSVLIDKARGLVHRAGA